MRPGKALEVQEYRLSVLNLGEMNGNLTRRLQFRRWLDGESRHTLTRSARFGADQMGRLAWPEGRDKNHLFDSLNPENCRHLHGVGVRRSRSGRAHQKSDVVGSAPKRHGRRLGINDDGYRLSDLLFADVIAQQLVGIVQNGLCDGACSDEAG